MQAFSAWPKLALQPGGELAFRPLASAKQFKQAAERESSESYLRDSDCSGFTVFLITDCHYQKEANNSVTGLNFASDSRD